MTEDLAQAVGKTRSGSAPRKLVTDRLDDQGAGNASGSGWPRLRAPCAGVATLARRMGEVRGQRPISILSAVAGRR